MLLNLIIDGNYILSRLVFTLHKNNLLYGALYTSLENTISNYRKIYPFCNIYFVSDSKEKSWRKDINKDYKSGRKKDSDIDWNFVYDTYNQFKKQANIKILESPNIEGDDWISYLVHRTNSNGESNLIISNDHDIKQLIKFDLNNEFINFMTNEMYNKGKLFMPKNWRLFVDGIRKLPNDDIFNLNDNREFLNLMVLFTAKYDLEEVDCVKSLMLKVISGDTSDNIKSVYQNKDKTGRTRGIGIKGAESVIERYYQEFGEPKLSDPDLHENIADLIIEKKKLSRLKMDEIISRIKQNITMVDLRLSSLPDNIVEKMKIVYEGV
jgi:5'-3' exonuclease